MDQNDPAGAPAIFQLNTQPGVRRDGTLLDSKFYAAAEWVRFQRGRPRKMGGYRLMSDQLSSPVRELLVDARAAVNSVYSFSGSGIEQLSFDNDGVAGGVVERTPAAFVPDDAYLWQSGLMYNASGGGGGAVIAAATPDADNIASDTAGPVYYGDVLGSGVFLPVQDGSGDILVSGGCCVLQPFLFVYGTDGLIRNSNPNDFSALSGWSGGAGLANSANPSGTKIVKGLPIRGGGRSPAGLFWSLDSLIRVSFVGGTEIWSYDPVSAATSVLSKNAIVEYDGVYYWPGVDRFFMYTGVVQELPNNMNLNFFYDNVNPNARNKTWAMKLPRFGEIWWFFPFGASTEPNHALIFNVRENTWYDTPVDRTAGASPQIFTLPVLAGGAPVDTTLLSMAPGLVGAFILNETVTGGTSGATGTVRRVLSDSLNVIPLSGTFVSGEVITGGTGGATVTLATGPTDQELDAIWLHESGVDRVYKQDVSAIRATFTTDRFNWMSGGPGGDAPAGINQQTRLCRMEPDFVLTGSMTVRVEGNAYAQAPNVLSDVFTFDADTSFVDMREQRREMSLTFESNEVGGDFQMGSVLLTAEPGDERG
jgi:hypothetical protein